MAAIDAAARAAGMTRSAWVKASCSEALSAAEIVPFIAVNGDDGVRTKVSVRFNAREIRTMETVSEGMGMSRANFIKKTVRAVLHRSEKYMALNAQMKLDIQAMTARFSRLGNMVNRIERRVNGAFNDGTLPELADHSADLLGMRETIMTEWHRVDALLVSAFAEEYKFWRGDTSDFSMSQAEADAENWSHEA